MSWLNATFNHNKTPFPLTGAHTSVQCAPVPRGREFHHRADRLRIVPHGGFQITTNPPHARRASQPLRDVPHHHVLAGRTFNHNNTPFPLTGAHTTVPCAACHIGNFTNLTTACYSCHQKDYKAPPIRPRLRRIPAGLLAVPQHHLLGRRDVQSQQYGFPLTGAHTRCSAPRATSAESSPI